MSTGAGQPTQDPRELIEQKRRDALAKLTDDDRAALFNTEDGYMIIELTWGSKALVPFEDGIKMLEILGKAQTISNDGNRDYPIITPLNFDSQFNLVSKELYTEYKMNELLGLHKPDATE